MNPPRRHSVFADRLLAFADFALDDERVFAHRGRWAAFLLDRIGTTFDGRVILEIGCADGDLLCRLAAAHPTTAFIGLDWKSRSIFDAAERSERLRLSNVVLLRGRGQDLARVFAADEVDEILLLHPDPGSTPAERQNALFNEPFLLDAHATLRGPTASLTLKTDHPGYYGWALAVLGLDEPPHFADRRTTGDATPSLSKCLIGDPRVRPADLLVPADRPPHSTAAAERFDVTLTSADVWQDPAALAHTAGRIFAGERTFFEARFLNKRQPIYYLELRKRLRADAGGRTPIAVRPQIASGPLSRYGRERQQEPASHV